MLLVQLFPLAVLGASLVTFQETSKKVANRVAEVGGRTVVAADFWRLGALLVLIYSLFLAYLAFVPFDQTGLYALPFVQERLAEYRELSMKLLDNPSLQYSYAFMEKVLAPLAAGFSATIVTKALKQRQYGFALVGLVAMPIAAFPTLIYGARGPLTMVVLAALMTFIVLNLRLLKARYLVLAGVLCLLPISLLATLRAEQYSARCIVYHTTNVIDRVVGRNYPDNIWHLAYVEQHGQHGIGAIEKLAPLFSVESKDILNIVGTAYSNRGGMVGLSFLELEPDGVCIPPPAPESDAAAVQSASSGAAFQTLNYAVFGPWSVPLSLALVLAMDLLLYVFVRLPRSVVAPVVGAISVPVLSLCFSFATTVLASKGLLLIPLVGLLLSGHRYLLRRG